MATIGDLIVNLRADIAQFRTALQEASTHVKTLQSDFQDLGSRVQAEMAAVEGAVRSVASALGVGFGVQQIESAIESTARLGEVSARLGISAESYQALAYAARQAGIDQNALNASIAFFEKSLGQAEAGIGQGAKAFQQLGISQQQARELGAEPIEKAIGQVVDRLNTLSDANQRAAGAQAILGRGWQTMLGVFAEGSRGFQELEDRAK